MTTGYRSIISYVNLTKAVKTRNKVKSPSNKTNSPINVKPRRGGNVYLIRSAPPSSSLSFAGSSYFVLGGNIVRTFQSSGGRLGSFRSSFVVAVFCGGFSFCARRRLRPDFSICIMIVLNGIDNSVTTFVREFFSTKQHIT